MPTTETPTDPKLARTSDIAPDARPDEVMDQIRALISECYPRAQRLASEAAVLFPDSDEIASADRVLNSPTGPVGTAPPEPSTDEEIEWLRDPPESLRGKWVALSGREVLAVADYARLRPSA